MSAELLEVRELCVHFPARRRARPRAGEPAIRAVDGVSFTLARGRSLGLVGESGCGKSTLARALLGLTRITSGAIALDGADLAERRQRQRIQMVFQDSSASLDPRLTVAAVLAEPLALAELPDGGRLPERERKLRMLALLEAVGLDLRVLDRYPHELSGGQRQRVAIARALCLQPDVLVCDEPTSALDASVRAQVLNLLAELVQRFGLSLLVISHDLAVVRHLCDAIAVMYLGRIVELADRASLFTAPQHPYTQALLAAVPTIEAGALGLALPVVAGEIPSPRHPPPGCAFHPRCPERERVPEGRCALETPDLLPIAPDSANRVACHLAR